MGSAFRQISRVRSLLGSTRWYLSDDCLLAAKQTMYAVEYRRFYLRDLESVIIWPSRLWLLRVIIPGALLTALAAALGRWVNSTAGMIFFGLAVTWVLLEVALGPTACSRISTVGTTVDLPLVTRIRRARSVVVKIDVAIRAARATIEPPATAVVSQSADAPVQTVSAPSSVAAAETHAS